MMAPTRHTTMRSLVLTSVLATLLFAAPASADILKVGDKLAELDVAKDAGGKSFKLKALKDKWVVITIGASWCKPCKKELPQWEKMAGMLKDKGVVFVAINADNDTADGKKFNEQLKLRNMTLVYLPADKSAVVERYGADTMPTTFVADGKGVVRFVKNGFNERDPDGEYKKFRTKLSELGIK